MTVQAAAPAASGSAQPAAPAAAPARPAATHAGGTANIRRSPATTAASRAQDRRSWVKALRRTMRHTAPTSG